MSDPGSPPPPSGEKSPDGSGLPGLAAFAVMGSTIAGCVGAGVALGIWVDHIFHTAPAGLLIGIVLGTVAAVVSVVQQVRRYL
ncbi:MAG: AtpZ/AtpI family protein [Acidobacteriota bacterium]|nr:AtpZ/AtpI family protein [Acidobacteriota bacterium]MDE3092780.1 AtpZ/AtpI family protein [Acidobacteriota bacterium]MDE3139017.1 AtpZ/AtpI family protein [Acidobacteriota bacterium]MDE3145868.1 AtpZ/AtpI family protein [Acidobacteriota bacterium]